MISHINGNSISTPSQQAAVAHLQSINATTESFGKVLNNTKEALISEGGSIELEPAIVSLPKESHVNLINLDKEIGKTEAKSIVPRKGVKYNPIEDNITVKNSTKDRIDTTLIDPMTLDAKVTPAEETPRENNTTKPHLHASDTNSPKENVNNSSLHAPISIPKKPLVLSADAISETDKRVAMANAKLGTSSKPVVADQLPSPKAKYEQLSTGSHPGMVMPIVITMLVVPMFAVLGYMALRRGQEAWKNRHYKRMDFLLDGMYND